MTKLIENADLMQIGTFMYSTQK